MKIFVFKESEAKETRVAATPETVKKLTGLGHSVLIAPGAGLFAGFSDAAYTEAGAQISGDPAGADIIFKVRRPNPEEIASIPEGASVIALMEPSDFGAGPFNVRNLSALSMEFTPRITRAQSMDALSSQSNLAGYRTVIEASQIFGRALPMMMTAAGTDCAGQSLYHGRRSRWPCRRLRRLDGLVPS